jgi:hypothetical protein
MTLTAARQVADAVLYEGYLLYPYRASSAKNQVRWQFGVLGPEGAVAAGVGEEPAMSAQVLLEPEPGAAVDVHLRFLQVQARVVQRRTADGWEPVDELLVDGTRWIPFHEAAPREVALPAVPADRASAHDVEVPGGEEVEELHADGALVGRLVRTRWPLTGTVTLTPRAGLDPRLTVLTLAVASTTTGRTEAGWSPRDVAARHSFVGTHLLVTAQGGRFVSLLDGPDWADADARACEQRRCWPVLVAADDGTDAVLVAPIILGDHPVIAPESAGDLFDATEIDEILTLRVLTLTDQERAEARGTDPRAAAILERCDAMTDAGLEALHGARRDDGSWSADGARPEQDSVAVQGVPVAKGSRVLLRPSRRADAQDLFLAGLTAVVSRVYFDLDGNTHVAVVLEDDPAADLYGSTGRYYYFGPEELEPLPAREDAR